MATSQSDMSTVLHFVQRWLSEPEPELGLGTLAAFDARTVSVRFAGGGETHTYAREQAPLRRVRFAIGDRLQTRAGERATVTAVTERGGLLHSATNSRGSPPCSA